MSECKVNVCEKELRQLEEDLLHLRVDTYRCVPTSRIDDNVVIDCLDNPKGKNCTCALKQVHIDLHPPTDLDYWAKILDNNKLQDSAHTLQDDSHPFFEYSGKDFVSLYALLFIAESCPGLCIPTCHVQQNPEQLRDWHIQLKDGNLHKGKGTIASLKRCLYKQAAFVVCPVSIRASNDTRKDSKHSNMIIWDTQRKIAERFEPLGTYRHDEFIDKTLKQFVDKYTPDYVYLPSSTYTDKGLQRFGSECPRADTDPGGFCKAWCLYFVHLRVNSPSMTSAEVYEVLKTGWPDPATLVRLFAITVAISCE